MIQTRKDTKRKLWVKQTDKGLFKHKARQIRTNLKQRKNNWRSKKKRSQINGTSNKILNTNKWLRKKATKVRATALELNKKLLIRNWSI